MQSIDTASPVGSDAATGGSGGRGGTGGSADAPLRDALGPGGGDGLVGSGGNADTSGAGGVAGNGGTGDTGGASGGTGGLADGGIRDRPPDPQDVPIPDARDAVTAGGGAGGATGGAGGTGGVIGTGGVTGTGGTVPPPVISSFAATPATITAGKPTTLIWTIFGAATASIDQGVGPVTGTSQIVTPASTTTYTLMVQNAAGTEVTARTTVTVVPAPAVSSFTAGLTPIPSGSSTSLLATFSNGTGVIDHGVGAVASGTKVNVGPLSATTIYTLTVTNAAGDAETAAVTVTVAGPGTFAQLGSTTPRISHTATLLPSGKVLIAGGMGRPPGILRTAELYDPVTQAFTATGSMGTERMDHTATCLASGKVLIAGGNDANAPLQSAELYDPVSGMFTATGSLTTPRTGQAAARLPDGKVLLVSGSNGVDGLTSAELYDPAPGTFAATPGTTQSKRSDHEAILLANGKVAIVGGNLSQKVELFDPAPGTFASVGQTAVYRPNPSVSLLPNGKILFSGGAVDNVMLSSAELYDLGNNTAAATGDMTVGRWLPASVLLESGKVLIAGGVSSTGWLASAELYDPNTGTFAATGTMVGPRYSPTATLLPDRKVLVVGGTDANDDTVPVAELYFY